MARLVSLAAAAALAAVLALATAPGAEAARAPCIPGAGKPLCHWTKGKVTFVADGDTLDVDVHGDGTSRPIRVRMIGVNAMELSVYSHDPRKRRGACHAVEAAARMDRLVRASRGLVRLSSQGSVSKTGARYRRSVAVRLGGRWRDAGQILIDEGHALWLPGSSEWAHNSRYAYGAQKAKAAGLRIWNPRSCGTDSTDATPLRMWVNWDADGSDRRNLNGEWAKIKNLDTANDLSLAGWWFRDSHHRRYNFPAWARIPAGSTITVRMGRGSSAGSAFFWGQRSPVFENASDDARAMGDGAYLFDPQGDLRAWMSYPCRVACTDPLRDAVTISVQPRGADEYVTVRNVSAAPVDLEGYMLENRPFSYAFDANTILAPGEALVVRLGGSAIEDTSVLKHWLLGGNILNDAADAVTLRNFTGTILACQAWGSASC